MTDGTRWLDGDEQRTWRAFIAMQRLLFDRLERQLQRAEDRRGSFAQLTEEGMAKLRAAAPEHVEAVRTELFDALTPAQLRALREISDAVVAHLCRPRP